MPGSRPWTFAIAIGIGSLTAQTEIRESLDQADGRWRRVTLVADGQRAGAARFTADDARIDLGPCPVDSRQSFTLRCALRTSHAGFCTPLMARAGNAVGLSLVMGRTPGHVSFEAWSWGSVKLPSHVRVDDGAWHAIEVAYDSATTMAALFVDGELSGCTTLGPGRSPHATLRLGNNIGAHQPYPGDIDEVSVTAGHDRDALFERLRPVLTDAERKAALAALRDVALPRRTPALAAERAADWPARRAVVREHVADALGLLPEPPNVPFDVQVHGELRKPGLRLQRVSWIGFPGMRATGWLWLPDPRPAGRLPTILCPHGHWQNGARHPVVQARCAAFARFGWLALAVDSVHVEDVAAGVNSVGAMTWHNQRALSWLLARDDVDPERVAVTGASGGGQQSYYLMALEDRIAAAAPIVMACYLHEIIADTSAHCGCNHTPRLVAGTDVPEMCAVFAPRPAFFGTVTGDWTRNFPRQGLPELTAHWQRLGDRAPASRHADEGHNYDRPMREAVYAFLHEHLLGQVGPVAEPDGELFALAEFEPLVRARPNATLDHRALANEHLTRRRPVAHLAALAPGLPGLATPPIRPGTLAWLDDPAIEFRRGTVTGEDGVPIPIRSRRQASPDDREGFTAPVTVWIDPRGSATLLAHAAAFEDSDHVLVDPRPYGEWSQFRQPWQRNGLILGRGEGYQAAVDVALVCQSLEGSPPIILRAHGEAGVIATLAATLTDRVVEVQTEPLGATYRENGNRRPLCPELLRFGDLPDLVERLPARVRHVVLPATR